jgi:hypothetical protein
MDNKSIIHKLEKVTNITPIGILKPGQNFDSHIGHSVVNLSDYTLSETQVSVLERGLTYCPTPDYPDLSEIWIDFKEFHRRLELKQFFSTQNTVSDQNYNQFNDKFKLKSNWKTPIPNKTVEAYKNAFRNDLLNYTPKLNHSNITKNQWESLRDLTKNTEITIKKADKVVVMNTKDYIREGLRQLEDPLFYKKLDHDPTEKFANEIDLVLKEMLGLDLITNKNYEFL